VVLELLEGNPELFADIFGNGAVIGERGLPVEDILKQRRGTARGLVSLPLQLFLPHYSNYYQLILSIDHALD
jgi:hypothetical protein